MDNEKIGKLIYKLRKEKGLTQLQLADMLNISDRTVSKWERAGAHPDNCPRKACMVLHRAWFILPQHIIYGGDMKILVINGSPKRDKSDTMHITQAFTDGMNDVTKNDIKTIHVMDKKINFCTGCLSCMRNGGVCMHDDDMKDIIDDILSSDILLFSFPLHSYGMPAPLKSLTDRLLPMSSIAMQKSDDHYEHILRQDVSHLRYIMICGSGFPNREDNFEPAVMQFNRMFRGENTVITVSEAPMFNAPKRKSLQSLFQISCAGQEENTPPAEKSVRILWRNSINR